jgi:hypothetical protein
MTSSDLAVRKCAPGQELDEKRARYVQNLCGLDGSELCVLRDNRYPTTGRHGLQDIHEQRYGSGRQIKRLLLPGIDYPNGQRPVAVAITRKTLARYARQISFLGGRRGLTM